MTRTLDDRLKAAALDVNNALDRFDPTPLVLAEPGTRRSRRPLLVALGTFVVTLAVAAVTIQIISPGGNGSTPATDPTSSAADPPTTTIATTVTTSTSDVVTTSEPLVDPDAGGLTGVKAAVRPTLVRELIGEEAYGGLWFDNTTGEAVVMLTPAMSVEDATAVLAELHSDIRIEDATYSFAELNEFYDMLVKRLPPPSGDLQIGLYVTRNQIGIATDDPSLIDTTGIPEDAIFFEPSKGPITLD